MLTLCQELRQFGHEVSFLTFRGRGLSHDVERLGYQNNEVAVRAKIDPLAILRMAKVIRELKADIVHTHLSTSTINGSLAAHLARRPAVATVHGLSGKLSFLPATHLICVSNDVRRHMLDQGVSASKLSVIHNGIVNIPTLSQAESRAILGVPLDRKIIGTTARLTPLKGVHHALHAMRHIVDDVPDTLFLVFGDGECRAEYEQLTQDLGLRDHVRFFGYREDVRQLLPALDLFVFPTLREAMGIAVVEAMTAGLPIVATKVGGLPEVVPPDAGILVPPGDPVSMANAARSLLKDASARRNYGAIAKEVAIANFSAAGMTSKTVGVYQTLLAGNRRV